MRVPEIAQSTSTMPLDLLVVEDEHRYRSLLIEMLGELGCRARGAGNAAQAMASIDASLPDAMLLDLHLPDMDGLALLDRFRARHVDTPVVILTGVGDLKSAQKAIRLGVTDFLTKPCHLGQIERAIDRVRRNLARGVAREPPALVQATDQAIACAESAAVRPIDELQRQAIFDALRVHRGNRSAAAAALGISRRTLYNRMREYQQLGFGPPVD